MKRVTRHFEMRRILAWLLVIASVGWMQIKTVAAAPSTTPGAPDSAAAPAEQVFDIWEFQVEGNTVLPATAVERAVYGHLGEKKTINDVNAAQQELEVLYHSRGYGSVLVDIPEQDVENGIVRLKVTEGKVGRLSVTGSRYFSLGRIKSKVPSLATGRIPDLAKVQTELGALGQLSRDRQITPVLKPSRTPGKLDVELKVKDTLPLHGGVELNDRFSADTSRLRLNTNLRYDNLWQREHSIGASYQIAPESPDEVEVFSVNYLWRFEDTDNLLALYVVRSNTNVATIGTLGVIGSGTIGGARYIIPLKGSESLYHTVNIGVDYKDFDEEIGFRDANAVVTPISYLKFSVTYNVTFSGERGIGHLEATANLAPDGFGNTQKEFERKRFKGIPNFAYLHLAADYQYNLWRGLSLFGKVQAQAANSPLITNEQFAVGGVDDVRGYLEAEKLGDNGVGGTIELRSPDLAQPFALKLKSLELLAFTDSAALTTKNPLPGTRNGGLLWSAGVGLRLEPVAHIAAAMMWAYPINAGDRTPAGDDRFHFNIGYEF